MRFRRKGLWNINALKNMNIQKAASTLNFFFRNTFSSLTVCETKWGECGGCLAPREILEIAQGWSRQREICMFQQIHRESNKVTDKQCQNTDGTGCQLILSIFGIFCRNYFSNSYACVFPYFYIFHMFWMNGYEYDIIDMWYLDILDPCANSMKLAVNRDSQYSEKFGG